MLVSLDVELAGFRVAELQQIQRSEIAGRIVEEHVFGAGVRGPDFARCGAGVPVIDGGVELDAGIGGSPGGIADLVPECAALSGLDGLAGQAAP